MHFDPDSFTKGVTVADGAWSSVLYARGYPSTSLAEMANLDRPEMVSELAQAYVLAGAKIITTNTFSANQFWLERRGLIEKCEAINVEGALIAREAAGDEAFVVGSIGPSGKIMAVKEIRETDLRKAVERQASALAKGGVDAIVLETFSEIQEVLISMSAAKDATGLPVIASLSYDSGPQRTRTMMGASVNDCVAALDDAGADIIGCNCGGGVENVLPALVAIRSGTQRPIWVKPNVGPPDVVHGIPVFPHTPDEFVGSVPMLIDAGVNIIGGCCGVGPEHIAKLSQIVMHHKAE